MQTQPHPLAPAIGTRVVVVVRDVGTIRAALLDVSDRFIVLGDPALGLYAEIPHGLVEHVEHVDVEAERRAMVRRNVELQRAIRRGEVGQ